MKSKWMLILLAAVILNATVADQQEHGRSCFRAIREQVQRQSVRSSWI
jgi:hypothetical protein